MIWDGRKRRQFLRRQCRLSAHVEIEGEEPVKAIIHNIGAGGTDLIMKKQPKVTSMVGIELLLPGENEPIKCEGKVVWLREHHHLFPRKMTDYEVGLSFKDLESDIKDRIVRLTHKLPGK